MLPLLMRIIVDGAAIAHSVPVVDPAMVRPAPVVNRTAVGCDPLLLEAGSGAGTTDRPGALLDRSRDAGQARRYLLFDLRDWNNCPKPISYDVPGQGLALGRNLLRPDAAPAAPRPFAPRPR
ncbi:MULTISPECIES: hypothetical protein [unclassified Brevundimonas]|uniref:hypothetical protein n=1 Tax=unclassified Brevundimonas TaxID=2622653 RepID=UPI0025BF557E|nr:MULTISPECIES: hypothetical protein [unclassified Brevundimonas]